MLFQVVFIVLLCALVAAVGSRGWLRRRKSELARGERAGTPFEMTAIEGTQPPSEPSTGDPTIGSAQSASASMPPPSSAGIELKVVRGQGRSPREDLQDLLKDRHQRGLCLACDAPATKPVPRTKLVEMGPGWIIRRFGAIPQTMTVIDPHPSTPACLCHSHYEIALRYIEEGMAKMGLDESQFLADQRERWLTFQRYGIFERMLDEQRKRLQEGAPLVKRGRGKTKLVSVSATGNDP